MDGYLMARYDPDEKKVSNLATVPRYLLWHSCSSGVPIFETKITTVDPGWHYTIMYRTVGFNFVFSEE